MMVSAPSKVFRRVQRSPYFPDISTFSYPKTLQTPLHIFPLEKHGFPPPRSRRSCWCPLGLCTLVWTGLPPAGRGEKTCFKRLKALPITRTPVIRKGRQLLLRGRTEKFQEAKKYLDSNRSYTVERHLETGRSQWWQNTLEFRRLKRVGFELTACQVLIV